MRPTSYSHIGYVNYLSSATQCYKECSTRRFYVASWQPNTCRCYDQTASNFVADSNYETTLIQNCNGNNTYLDVLTPPEYAMELRKGDYVNINSTAVGDIWGTNRLGRYGPLINRPYFGKQLSNEMDLADFICKQKGFTSAIGFSQASVFTWDQYFNYAAFSDAECEAQDTNFSPNCSYTASHLYSDTRYLRIGAICTAPDTLHIPTTDYLFNLIPKEGYALSMNNLNKFGFTLVRPGYDSWTLTEADVVCKSAGYYSAMHAFKLKSSLIGWGNAFRYVTCNGNEQHLAQCSHTDVTLYYGGYHYYAAAICASNQSEVDSPTLRLFEFQEPDFFHHHFKYDGLGAILMKTEARNWSLICDDHFSLAEADVACRQMGYFGADDLLKGFGYRYNNHYQIYHDDGMYHLPNRPFVKVKCTGTENRLHDCQWEEIGDQCESRTAAGISCSDVPRGQVSTTLEIINSPPNKTNEGTLRASNRLGQTGYVNDWRWTMPETEVACDQLGFTSGVVGYTWGSLFRNAQKHYPYSEAMYATQCFGNESHIQNCSYSAKGSDISLYRSFYGTSAGVICNGKLFTM